MANRALTIDVGSQFVDRSSLQAANQVDLEAGRENGLSPAMLDRLELTDARIESMAASVEQIADQPDPVGKVIEGRVLDNGIKLTKLRHKPIADAVSAALKAGRKYIDSFDGGA